ncbi:MAG: GPW/gp25 family protein [Bacteroidetes bacterium]|nr:GPW/gp25 family protein [Bacteroidota bacterium]
MATTNSFLGTGWKFPIEFSKAGASNIMLSDEDDIQNSLQVLLTTRVGERIMQPAYGCNMDVLIFEAINESLITYIKDLVFTAIYYFEPRISPDNVNIESTAEEGIILVNVAYTIRSTNSRQNLVFPFYLDEGNLVLNSGA